MNGPSIELSDSDGDSVIEISPSSFQIPSRLPAGMGADMGLINRRKVSGEVLSMSSASLSSGSGSSGSEASGTEETESGDSDWQVPRGASPDRMVNERQRMESEMNEKRDILFKMDRMRARGYEPPRNFTMESNLLEMRAEYERVVREKELDSSIQFQQQMLMTFVTGVEFLNDKFDPVGARLSGWSLNVNEGLPSYEDIFVDLHDKYRGTGKKMAPELRLLLSLSGSAFMFHLTNSIFKRSGPDVGIENLIRSDPELLRQVQAAAMSKLNNNASAPQQQQMPQQQAAPSPMNIFGMVGNMFGAPSRPPPVSMPQQQQAPQQNMHQNISMRPPQNARHETMSMSDVEITSIIEDTADLAGVISDRKSVTSGGRGVGGGSRKPAGRTLQL